MFPKWKQKKLLPKNSHNKYSCPNCDKVYKSRSGLYKHSQTCVAVKETKVEEQKENQIVTNDDQTFMTTCMQTMMAMMNEMKAEKEERMKMREQMSELIQRLEITIITVLT